MPAAVDCAAAHTCSPVQPTLPVERRRRVRCPSARWGGGWPRRGGEGTPTPTPVSGAGRDPPLVDRHIPRSWETGAVSEHLQRRRPATDPLSAAHNAAGTAVTGATVVTRSLAPVSLASATELGLSEENVTPGS